MSSASISRNIPLPREAVARIPRKCNVSFGLGPSNPPSLLASLADRVDAGDVDEIHLYYQIAKDAAKPLFKTKYLGSSTTSTQIS